MADDILRFAILGLGAGAVYAVTALGVVLIYRGSGVVNFAHGAIGMVGAFLFYNERESGTADLAGVGPGPRTRGAARRGNPSARHATPAPSPGDRAADRDARDLRDPLRLGAGSLRRHRDASSASSCRSTPSRCCPTSRSVGTASSSSIVGVVLTVLLTVVYRATRFGLATSAVAESRRVTAAQGISPDLVATLELGPRFDARRARRSARRQHRRPLRARAHAAHRPGPGGRARRELPFVHAHAHRRSAHRGAPVGDRLAPDLPHAAARTAGDARRVGRVRAVPRHHPRAGRVRPLLAPAGRCDRASPGDRRRSDRSPRPRPGARRRSSCSSRSSSRASTVEAVTTSAAFGVIVLSLVVVTGFTGQLSLAQFALAGIGGWIAATLVADQGAPFVVAAARRDPRGGPGRGARRAPFAAHTRRQPRGRHARPRAWRSRRSSWGTRIAPVGSRGSTSASPTCSASRSTRCTTRSGTQCSPSCSSPPPPCSSRTSVAVEPGGGSSPFGPTSVPPPRSASRCSARSSTRSASALRSPPSEGS